MVGEKKNNGKRHRLFIGRCRVYIFFNDYYWYLQSETPTEGLRRSWCICSPFLFCFDDDGECEASCGIQGPAHSEQVTENRRTQAKLDSPPTSAPHHRGPRRLSPPRFRPPRFLPRWPPHFRKLLLALISTSKIRFFEGKKRRNKFVISTNHNGFFS